MSSSQARGKSKIEPRPFTYPDVGVAGTRLVAGTATAETEMDHARNEGRRLGEHQAQTAYAAALAKERIALQQAVADFVRERQTYFEQVEGEVVQLAVGIARRVLEREVETDPLVLAAMARVVLSRMQAGSKVTLRVAPSEVSSWVQFFAAESEGSLEVVPDPSLAVPQCRIETAMGTTELSVAGRLQEIEQSFSQLLARRPKP